jgi:asparagine synthase (glutamine-hydrolysing)
MISGIFLRNKDQIVDPGWLSEVLTPSDGNINNCRILCDGSIGFSYYPQFSNEKNSELKPVFSKTRNFAAVFAGKIYNKSELSKTVPSETGLGNHQNTSKLIIDLYRKYGNDFATKINGKFAFAIWDNSAQKLFIGRDRMGIEPLYYYADENSFVFSSSIPIIFKCTKTVKELNFNAVGKFLLFNYNPGLETFFKRIFRLRPAHILAIDREFMKIDRYWKLSFQNITNSDEEEVKDKLLEQLRDAVHIRIEPGSQPGVFLSGGMDSSTVLALSKEISQVPLKSFSYRCRSESFDESIYAKYMAKSTNSEHYECEYTPEDVLSMPDIVKKMNEPFCDVGINIATHILGKIAKQYVSYVLTGDGGDELFGGHPVYEADKIGSLFDAIPSFIKNPMIHLFSHFPDSDKKKNFIVKAKRFSESIHLPPDLLSHRWRVYYNRNDLFELLNSSLAEEFEDIDLYEDILKYNREADGPDLLSQALYSDYQTAVDFYLRRNDLNRSFSIDSHYPLLDHRLVEFCASIPSKMKINGWFDTKYIFKKAMEKVLPHKIIYRKDKLGHSIPLKNWIRENKQVGDFILDHVSTAVIKKRGYFNPERVDNLIDEHINKRRNNSHRLWALAVLEMWFRENLDN